MAISAFSGSYDHSLDGKGRVIIPASFRGGLGENFTLTLNPQGKAVAIYPEEVWQEQLDRLSRINPLDKRGVQYERYLMSMSFAGNSMDTQGRVLLPMRLRAKIGLTKDIVFIGLNRYIEIWDAETYRQQEAETEMGFEDLVDYVYETYQEKTE